MTAPAPMPVDVAESVVASQVKAQVRIGLAAVAGALVGRHLLPAGLVNDTFLDAICALIFGGLAAGWQWGRTAIEHSRWWHLALDPRVPAALVRPKPSSHPSADVPIDPPPAVPASLQEQDMSIIAKLGQEALDLLKKAGLAIEEFVMSEGQKLVAAAKQTFVGTAVFNIISALENHSMSGAEKMETVIAAAVPLIEKLVASGGIGALETSAEDFARELCQSVYNDFKAAAEKVLGADPAPTTTSPVA